MLNFTKNYINYIIILIVCIVAHGNTIFNDYTLDDGWAIVENVNVNQGFKGIPKLFVSANFDDENVQYDYRPLNYSSFALIYGLTGTHNSYLDHAINFGLFCILTLVIFTCLKKIFRLHRLHPSIPLVIVLLYITHPSITDTIANTLRREQILAMLFAFLAIIQVNLYFEEGKNKNIFIFYTLWIMSLLSKMFLIVPIAIIIPLILLFNGHSNQKKKFFIVSVSTLFLTFGASFLNVYTFNGGSLNHNCYSSIENPLLQNNNIYLHFAYILQTLWFYLKFMLVPFPLGFYYGNNMFPLIELTHPVAIISFCVHLALFIFCIYLIIKKKQAGIFILFYLINISFYSNIFIFAGVVAERILFIASLWFIAALVLLYFSIYKYFTNTLWIKPVSVFLFFSVLSIYLYITINRNFQWKDDITLMSNDVKHLKKSIWANHCYADILVENAEKYPKGEEMYRKAITHYKVAYSNDTTQKNILVRIADIYKERLKMPDSANYYIKIADHYSVSNTNYQIPNNLQ